MKIHNVLLVTNMQSQAVLEKYFEEKKHCLPPSISKDDPQTLVVLGLVPSPLLWIALLLLSVTMTGFPTYSGAEHGVAVGVGASTYSLE